MKRLVVIVLAAVMVASCAATQRSWDDGINIIPAPLSLTAVEGTFDFTPAVTVSAEGEEASRIADSFISKLSAASGILLNAGEGGQVVLRINPDCGLPAEGYTLNVTSGSIIAEGADGAGLFYAVQTMLQLLPAEVESAKKVKGVQWSIPCVSITDYPRFQWRGFHVDPCRHFYGIDELKKQIDMLSEFKVNVMHWHLTDDQGWRIEIKKYPKLTEVGAWRTEFDGSVHGGFYTQEEIADLVAYAAERYMTVVPEIEMPGHAVAVIRAYPELSCEGRELGTFYNWGTTENVFCVGNEKVFEFLEDVVAEVSALFPGKYFHIGGDECLKTKWEVCPTCQAKIKELGLKADAEFTAEQKLQSYAVARMETILAKYGKKLVGWDEILEGGLSPDATVMSWQGESGGIKSAMEGHQVVMTPSHEGLYLDSYQGDSKCEPVGFGRYIPLEKIYEYNPVPAVLEENGKAEYVLGVQANTWSEYIYSDEHREYMMYPRLLALSEIAWSRQENKDFADFIRRTDNALVRLDYHGINYHVPLPEQPGGSCDNLAFTDTLNLEFTTTRPVKMVYTLDGRTPGARSEVYTKPFTFTENACVKIRSVLANGKMSAVRTVNAVKSELAPAVQPDGELEQGLVMRKVYGNFASAADLASVQDWEESVISDLAEMPRQETYPRDMQGVKFFACEASGYVDIPRDGVWRFSTDDDQLWIDGKLLIDNGTEVKRYSRHDAEAALSAGLHEIKVVFVSNIIGGWVSAKNKGTVTMQRAGEEDSHRVKPERIFYCPKDN